jgi:hypothetical protein
MLGRFLTAGWPHGRPELPRCLTAGGHGFGQATDSVTLATGQFAIPACGSGNQDYMIANVILMPVFTIIDGYRRGLRRPWLFFLSSLFTSFAFPFAFYFATIERQRRHAQSSSAATTIGA